MNMKKNIFYFLLLMLSAMSFTCCSDDDDEPKGNETEERIVAMNDLETFQDAMTFIDDNGLLTSRKYGKPLPSLSADTNHVYIGVADQAEAETLFRSWVANEEHLTETGGQLVFHMADTLGRAQGTATYATIVNGEHSELARVTFSQDCAVRYLSQISFIDEKAWPENGFRSLFAKWDIVDVTNHHIDGSPTLPMVCIRAAKPGQDGLLMTVEPTKKNNFGETRYFVDTDCKWNHMAYPTREDVKFIQANNKDLKSQDFKDICREAGVKYDGGWEYWVFNTPYIGEGYRKFKPNKKGLISMWFFDYLRKAHKMYILHFDDKQIFKKVDQHCNDLNAPDPATTYTEFSYSIR